MSAVVPPARRPLSRRVLHVVRRAHLATGLFLLPWAVLYGVTAFLFNHPTAFADQPTTHFGRAAVAGTALESVPAPLDTATHVAAELTRRGQAVELVHPAAARFNRDSAFATVNAGGQTVSVLVDATTGGGTVRSKPDAPPKPTSPPAPFAVGRSRAAASPRTAREPLDDGVRTPDPLHERMRAALPTILDRCGYPGGELTVTSTPEVVFFVRHAGRDWQATYTPLTGAVAGVPAESVAPPELSARRFLLRLHTAHGYPGEADARWWWAVVVDATAAVMVFWAASGLAMWWQLKATRRWGAVVIALSLVAAGWLAAGMYALLVRA